MPTRSVTARLEEDLIVWADAYAAQRESTRSKVIDAALRALRTDAEGGVPDLEPSSSAAPGTMPRRARSASDRAAAAGDSRPPAAAPALPADLVRRTGARMAREIVAPGSDVRRVRLEVIVARLRMPELAAPGRVIPPIDLARARSKVKAGGVLVNEVVERDPGRLIGEEMVALA